MELFLLDAFVARYVCAVCWGRLTTRKSESGRREPVCERHQWGECDGRGFVTLRYAYRRRDESTGELFEVKRNYPALFPAPKVSEAQIMKALGF